MPQSNMKTAEMVPEPAAEHDDFRAASDGLSADTQGSAGSRPAEVCQLCVVPEFTSVIVPFRALADKPSMNQNARERGGDADPVFPLWKNAPTVNPLLAATFQE